MKLKEAYDKIDNTLCLNSQKLEFNRENAGIDCKDVKEMVHCLDTIQEALEVLEIIKANKNIIFSKNPKYENMNADDFFKLSRWLEE